MNATLVLCVLVTEACSASSMCPVQGGFTMLLAAMHASFANLVSLTARICLLLQGCGDDCDNMVQHTCLTYEGQSGSGMWSENNQSIHSIVTGAISLDNNDNLNVGIMLNPFVYNTISSWYNEDASEPLPLTPAPPSAPASHHGYNDNSNSAGWFNSHVWVVVVPCVVGAIILLALLCCLISCIRRSCRRRKPVVVGPQSRIPPYPAGPQGAYASQYAQHAQHPQNQLVGPPTGASAFAQSFYNNGDPSAPNGYNRRW